MLEYSESILNHIKFAVPELFIGISFVLILVLRLIFNDDISKKIFSKLCLTLYAACGILKFAYSLSDETFSDCLFVFDKTIYFLKTIIMFCATFICFILSLPKYYKKLNCIAFMLTFGISLSLMICISANNFLTLFLGLEGFILSNSFLLFLKDRSQKEHTNSIRYLILNAIASGMFLYGLSLYYADLGSLCFAHLDNTRSFIFVLGTILITSFLLFEIHAAPFHSWIVGVYSNMPLKTLAIFDTIFQFFMLFIFAKIISVFIAHQILFYKPFLYCVSILSMLIGSVTPLVQDNIKKFIAFSSIGHVGFMVSIFAVANYATDFKFPMVYISAYVISSVCFFSSLLSLKSIKNVTYFSDLKGIIRNFPITSYCIILSMLSMIGLPPFINFVAKLNILSFLIENRAWKLLYVSVIYTIMCFVYTVKVLRHIFDTNTDLGTAKKESYLLFIPLGILILGIFVLTHIEFSFSNVFSRIN